MKKVTSLLTKSIAAATLFLGISVGVASAHVTVSPNQVLPGSYQTYTIKVPVEKPDPTLKVALKIPKGLEFKNYQPIPGWKVDLEKDGDGMVKSITWSSSEGIQEGQFQQFNFVAKNPDKEGTAAWDAYQYYKDGTVVEWTGEEGSDSPHSITKITSDTSMDAAMTDDHHDDEKATDEKTETTKKSDDMDHGTEDAGMSALILAIIALVAAVGALFVALRKRK